MKSGYLLPTLFAAGCLGTQHGQTADRPTVDTSFVSVMKLANLLPHPPFPMMRATSIDVGHVTGSSLFNVVARNSTDPVASIYQFNVLCAGGVLPLTIQDDPVLPEPTIYGIPMLDTNPPHTTVHLHFSGGLPFDYTISDLCSPTH